MSLDELLKNLQKEYLAELPARIETMHAHLENKDVTALIEDFHKLKGTGKTYGVAAISDVGARLEKILLEKGAKALDHVPEALAELVHIHSEHSQEDLPLAG